jgi:hypothetical protein
MKTRLPHQGRSFRPLCALPLFLSLFLAAPSRAANTWNYYLQAGATKIPAGTYSTTPQVPNEDILMWGYAQCTDATFASCQSVAFPGPALIASEGDTLHVFVNNNLVAPTEFPSMTSEPTSLVIPGQYTSLAPVWVGVTGTGGVTNVTGTGARPANDSQSRVRSFTTETAVGSTTQYSWSNLKPGTYLYQSGTHPAVQVQMGLSGPLKVYPSATPASPTGPALTSGQAYDDASTMFDSEVVLLYSEVDPELHYSIASGLYGTPPPAPPGVPIRGQRTSTVKYAPRFFLVNGLPNPNLQPIPNAGQMGKRMLVRILNAGLREKTPTVLNQDFAILAEDGNPYRYVNNGVPYYTSHLQYSALLPAGKTLDAILIPPAAGKLPLFDRSLNLTNAAMSAGGQLVYLVIAPCSTPAPTPHRAPGVSSPTDAASWRPGALHTITWVPLADSGDVKIELVKAGQPIRTLASAQPARSGALVVSLPASLKPAKDYTIRITGKTGTVTSRPFTIAGRLARGFAIPFRE